MEAARETVSFTRMDQGTREDYQFLDGQWRAHHGPKHLTRSVLAQLKLLQGPKLGYPIDRYQHSLQSATRALRDGADEETVVCALLHDIGDTLAPDNHSGLAAAVLLPYVSERNHWVVLHHGLFQGYYFWHHVGGNRNARERYRGHAYFEACAEFCERWDQTSFDPDYDTLPLSDFEPMVRRIFARPPHAHVD
jgi:predicted HD phosphohydrolase